MFAQVSIFVISCGLAWYYLKGSNSPWPLRFTGKFSAVLVIAHPDDEAMFFVPLIKNLASAFDFSILCLSTGNANGLGRIRQKELTASAISLGIPADRVFVVDNRDLQDGMGAVWKKSVVASAVRVYVDKFKPNVIFTFDSGGVSGHSNHISIYEGIKSLLSSTAFISKHPDIVCYTLRTVPITHKFFSVLGSLIERFLFLIKGGTHSVNSGGWPSQSFIFSGYDGVVASHAAMVAHHSQYVSFRRLFIVFSTYTMTNVVTRLDTRAQSLAASKVSTHVKDA